MICPKCKKAAPVDGATFCPWCGRRLTFEQRPKKPKLRGNGQGTAYKRGKTWTALWRHYSGDQCVRVSRGGFPTKSAALEWISHIHDAPRENPNVTFAALYERWISRHAERVSVSTISCYRSAYKYFEPVHFWPFCHLTTDALQQCVDACPHGTRTKENMKALCTSLSKYAHEIGVAAEDYGKHIYIKREPAKEKRAFTPDELERLFAAAATVPNVDIILVLCYTGFRINELLSMERSAFDPEALTLRGGSKTAAGKNRIVTISPKILPFVESRYDECGERLFCENGRPLKKEHWEDLQRRALSSIDGVRELLPHECRHTFASLMKRVNAPTVDKKRLIGHTSDAMLEHYTHAHLAELRAITDQI